MKVISSKPLSEVRELTTEQLLEQMITDLEITSFEHEDRIAELEERVGE